MTSAQWIVTAAILASTLVVATEGFAPPKVIIAGASASASTFPTAPTSSSCANALLHSNQRESRLYMSDNDEGPGLVTKVFISGVLLFFVASAFAPLMDFAANPPSANDLNLADSVVTRQDGDKLSNYQSKFDALSPKKVQEKLSNLPVFYLSSDGKMGDKIYLSFNQAEDAASKSSQGSSVKVATLDQVMYPLVLKREATKQQTSTAVEIKNAIESVQNNDGSYSLVPSTAALNDAKDMTLKKADIPLFVVERLAFASNDGKPEVPLFTDKNDAIVSYNRLRESGGNKLPAEPTIRTTSLLDVLESMEKGTRPAVGQLQFYGNAEDVLKADEIMSR
ncbi:hypothetical protein ACHAXR_013177 [Thalassiosira sp. AJA248-18]